MSKTPPSRARTLASLITAGEVIPPTEDLADVLDSIPLGVVTTAGSDALEVLRSDDRL